MFDFGFIDKEWFIQNAIWDIFFAFLFIGLLKIIYKLFCAFKISKKILKNNRPVQGRGTKAADIFLEIWKGGKN